MLSRRWTVIDTAGLLTALRPACGLDGTLASDISLIQKPPPPDGVLLVACSSLVRARRLESVRVSDDGLAATVGSIGARHWRPLAANARDTLMLAGSHSVTQRADAMLQ